MIQDSGSRLGNNLVILHSASWHSNAADHLTRAIGERQSSREGDQTIVGVLDVEERAPRLGETADRLGVHLEEGGGLGFLHGYVHGP